jgi:hypothetical protein
MPTKFTVSSTNFVVRAPAATKAAAFRRKLEELGAVQTLSGHPELFLLKLDGAPAPSKKVWEQLREALGPNVVVLPVFVDESGVPHVPVGTVTARFRKSLSDRELSELLKPLGLQVKARNKYVPTQLSLELVEPGQQFLPDVLEAVEQFGDRLVAVWPETLIPFQKA